LTIYVSDGIARTKEDQDAFSPAAGGISGPAFEQLDRKLVHFLFTSGEYPQK
jgi:hypothetical protein